MSHPRLLALVLAGAFALSLIGLRGARTQSAGLRRVTNTSEEGININPSISGDGRILAFESSEDIAGAGGSDHFRAIRANITLDPATFLQLGGTRAVAPAISQDGSRIAFASKDDPLGANADGNPEIFLFDGTKLIQVTNTSPGDIANRVTNGNFQPSITDDGRFIAFSSNRDLATQNSDGNLEIFIYDAIAGSFTQLTNSSGIVGASDAKISGNGASVAYIRDAGATPSSTRDLLEQPRVGPGPVTLLASNVQSLAMTYGRAISDDGTRVVYSAETATNSTQVFLFDGRFGGAARQITSLGVRATEVPLHPTISGDGLRIAFATRRSVSGTTSNSDGSVELYLFDIPSSQVSKITDVPSGVTADVLSSLNDDGSIAAFNFPRTLSGAVSNSDSANNSEIYVTGTPARPPFGALTVLNGASFGNEPSSIKALAPDSIAVARGGALANTTMQAPQNPNKTFPTNVAGTTVTVNGRAAQVFYVSPSQVNFLVPPQTEIGTADVVVTNSEGFSSRGTVPTLRTAPGVFTRPGDGTGEGIILSNFGQHEGPFDPSNGGLELIVFSTGARFGSQTLVVMGGRALTAEYIFPEPDMPGLDEVRVKVPADLRGAGTVDLFVQSDGRTSNPVAVTFTGDGTRDILINEVLADPPDGIAGDANHDGVRDSSDDEFVELVNTTSHDIDMSGFQLLSRSSSTTTDTTRHTFTAGTILPACADIVVFGGGAFDPTNAAFGGSQVVKAASGGLSLTNSGGVITLGDQSRGIVTSLSYGGSTGLNAGANQSLTRAPDKTGNFVLHQAASGSGGRSFSPGTQLNGSPFALCNTFVRIDVSPSSAAVDAGAKQQFTAKASNANGVEVPGVIFSWQSGNTSVATIDQNGLAASSTAGSTEIRASARGTQSAPATLTVREVQRVLTRVDVTPQSATIPATGAQQFTAKGIDQFGNEITGLTFAWESSNTSAATIDQTGLASGINQGQSTIKATSQSVSGTATLNVTASTVVVNEVLADPPTGTDGDANHDGTRDSGDDEFVELVNSTNGGVNISGWTVRTHSTNSATETVRHTFAANTNFPAGEAMLVFGGGTFKPANPLFGCAQVAKASSGGLSLTNGGLTILVRDGSGNLVTQFSYGGTTGLNGGNAQSLTRSPDISGNFVLHTTPAGAGGRKFSPGVKLDGTPFGNCTLLTINAVTLNEGNSGTTTFTFTVSLSTPAPPGGVTFDIATQDNTATVANNDYVARSLTGQTIAAGQQTHSFDVTVNGDLSIEPSEAFFVNVTNVSGALVGDGQGVGTILNDDSPVLSINDVSANEGNAGTTTFTFTVTSTLPAPAGGITFDIATANGTATTAGGDYVARSLTGQTIAAGQTSYTFDVTVNGDSLFEPNERFFVNVTNVSGASLSDGQGVGTIQNDDTPLVDLSQLYGGGGNTGSTYKNDFIEVFNRGNTTVDLAGWSVQYTSAAGTGTWSVTPLCPSGPCLLLPGRYFLVQEDQGAGGTTNLPTPDAIGTISMTTGAGKLALRASTTPLSGACPSSTSILDVVGYGSSATCFEGTAPTAAPGNTTSVFRRSGGCTDTNDNAADSFVSAPFPRNSSSPTNNCVAGTPPNLTIDDVTVTEGNAGTVTATFTVSLSAPAPSSDVTFDIATQNNTATTANSDYVAKNLTSQIIPAGQTTYTFSVTVNGDVAIEPDETLFVHVTNVTGATVTDGQGLGTIQNDDLPTLSIDDVSASEGNSGPMTFTFHVSLSAAAPATVTFDITTADGTAQDGIPGGEDNDYVAHSITAQTIAAGATSFNFDVTVNGDLIIEPNETFFVNVTNVSGATILDGQGQGTIQNDDSPVLSITPAVSVTEGNTGTTTATFTVTLSPASNQTVTVDYATANGTATAGSDYSATNGTLTFNPLETSKPINVTVSGDTLVEPHEAFSINLSNQSANASISPAQGTGTGTITNDDKPLIVISQIYGGGGNSGATYKNDFIEIFNRGTSTVSLPGYSVQYAGDTATSWSKTDLTNVTLSPGKYYLIQEAQGAAGTNSLPAPDATGIIAMATAAGKVALVNNTTLLSGSCPSTSNILELVGYGATASCFEGTARTPAPSNTTADFRKSGGCVDTNDNAADFVTSAPNPRHSSSAANDCSTGFRPDIGINDPTAVTEGDSGTTTLTFNITLSAPNNTQTVTVNYTTADGTATAGADYQTGSGTVTFNPAETTKPIVITINSDLLDEANETFFVSLSSAINAAILDPQGQGTINDNDPTPSLSINDLASVPEGDSGTSIANFTVTLSAASGQTVTVNFATADGTATIAGSDYAATSGTLTFNPGETTRPVATTINGDTTFEPNETFFVNLTTPINAGISDSQGQGTIINDDAAPASADLSVTKADSPDPVAIGSNINYSIILTNNGPDSASAATLTDTIPANTTFQSITPPAGWACTTPPVNGTGTVTCSRGTAMMTNGQSFSFPVTVQVDAATPSGTVITNTAIASSATADSNSGNDSATAKTTAVPAGTSDLSITRIDSPDPVTATGNINYTVTVNNNGPGSAVDATLTDTVPTNTTFQSITPPAGWACVTPPVNGAGTITCIKSTTFALGQSAVFPLVVKVNSGVADGTTITNTASVSSTTTDGIPGNNSATATTTVGSPVLVISQIHGAGNNSGAAYQNDFVQIFNRGTASVDFTVTPYSVQYAASASSFTAGNKVNLTTGTLAPGQYLLIKMAGGTTNGVAFTGDLTSSIDMSATNGKVALVVGTTLATTTAGGCPTGVTVADLVGYGTANCAETTATAALSVTRVDVRNGSGCTDTGDNSADFTVTTVSVGSPPIPKNSSSPVSPCP